MSGISVNCLPRLAILLGIALSACHDEETSLGSTPIGRTNDASHVTRQRPPSAGSMAPALVLENNGGGDVTVTANGGVTFATTSCPATLTRSPFTRSTGIPTRPARGCPQSIVPDTHVIGAADANFEGGDGTMMVASIGGRDDANVQGDGTTVWPITLTEECPARR
jgi:hypothetical protein